MAVRHTALAAIVLSLLPAAASAATFTLLKTFCESTNCRDGNTPGAPLLRDPDGNLFGTTVVGGAHGKGVVFEMRKTGAGYTYQRVYDFCSQPGCTDGHHPYGGLIMDQAGNLYGTASEGGNGAGGARGGAVFKLSPRAKPFQEWIFTKLHDFCAKADCADGKTPMASPTYQGAASGALYDGVSPLFGTTVVGGTAQEGVAYRLTFIPGRSRPLEAVLHSFCAQPNCADGRHPSARLTVDGAGNLYGTADYGGANGATYNGGVVFQLTPHRKSYVFGVLHSFCALANCADGNLPGRSGLTLDGDGNLLGSTVAPSGGLVYKLVPAGAGSTMSTVYQFCSQQNCTDGSAPDWPLLVDTNGDIVGSTNDGGTLGPGTVYRLHGGVEQVLHNFCLNCDDGAYPVGIAMDGAGTVFGATFMTHNMGEGGTVYEIAP